VRITQLPEEGRQYWLLGLSANVGDGKYRPGDAPEGSLCGILWQANIKPEMFVKK
jgi:hypothetical protein